MRESQQSNPPQRLAAPIDVGVYLTGDPPCSPACSLALLAVGPVALSAPGHPLTSWQVARPTATRSAEPRTEVQTVRVRSQSPGAPWQLIQGHQCLPRAGVGGAIGVQAGGSHSETLGLWAQSSCGLFLDSTC